MWCDIADADGRQVADAEPSPVWVPDPEAAKCMHCKKSEFTVINRRVTDILSIVIATRMYSQSLNLRRIALVSVAT